jgi:hypothetical protein
MLKAGRVCFSFFFFHESHAQPSFLIAHTSLRQTGKSNFLDGPFSSAAICLPRFGDLIWNMWLGAPQTLAGM